MALSNVQAMEVVDLFVNNFVLEKNYEKRLRLFQRFGDIFGKGVVKWKEMAQQVMEEKGVEKSTIEEYKNIMYSKKDDSFEYEIRELVKEDFSMVREILNDAFDTLLTVYDDEQLEKFITGYSLVACDKGDILGVVLACAISGLYADTVYIDSLAVAQYAREKGIAKRLISTIRSKAYQNKIYTLKLMTDKKIEAYQMYKHIGFVESKHVLMTKW